MHVAKSCCGFKCGIYWLEKLLLLYNFYSLDPIATEVAGFH